MTPTLRLGDNPDGEIKSGGGVTLTSALPGARGRRKQRRGVVVSDSMNKTRVVRVSRDVRHRLYEKVLRQRKNYYAHDEQNSSKAGDSVLLEETRPMSRLKRWRIIKIIQKKGVAG